MFEPLDQSFGFLYRIDAGAIYFLMEKRKREKLEAKGLKVGTVAEFLELAPHEVTIIELKLALSKALK